MILRKIDSLTVIQLFNQLKKENYLHPELYRTGCIERTRIICDEMISKGVGVGFAIMPKENNGEYVLSSRAMLKNGVRHNFKWTQHCVPFITNERDQKIVLDVCLMNAPERFETWQKNVLYQNNPITLDDCIFCATEEVPLLSHMLMGYKNPFARLECFSKQETHLSIIPFQKKSRWYASFLKMQMKKLLLER